MKCEKCMENLCSTFSFSLNQFPPIQKGICHLRKLQRLDVMALFFPRSSLMVKSCRASSRGRFESQVSDKTLKITSFPLSSLGVGEKLERSCFKKSKKLTLEPNLHTELGKCSCYLQNVNLA